MRIYRTRLEALWEVRHALTERMAEVLASVDKAIEEEMATLNKEHTQA